MPSWSDSGHYFALQSNKHDKDKNRQQSTAAALKIIRAEHLGMCFGVRDAIALALGRAEAAPLTILGDLVHNTTVQAALQARGIAIAYDVSQVKTHTVMVTAHGASERTLASTRALGLNVVEATCPLVHVGPPRRHGARARGLSSGHHRAACPRGGSGSDRRSRRLRRDPGRPGCAGPRGAPAHRHRRADDAIDREGAAPGRARSAPIPRVRRPVHRYRLSADEAAPERRCSSWRASATSSSSSAARTATTRASW